MHPKDTKEHPERILLIHPGALGDLIQAFPAFGRIRQTFDAAHMALLVGGPFAAFARKTGLFNEILSFDADVAYHGGAIRKFRLLAGLAAELKRWTPSRVGVFKGAPIYAALARLSGAPLRVGLTRGFGKRLLTTGIAIDPRVHREDRYLAVARALGADGVSAAEAGWESTQKSQGLGEGPLIGIAPGGARNVKEEMPTRRWASDRYAELAVRLRELVPEARIVLLGGAGDRKEAEMVKRALPESAITDLVGRTSLADARAVIAQLSAFVGHDSGLLHVAATTATPIVAIFGPTDPRVVCPRGQRIQTLWNPAFPTACYDEVTGRLGTCSVNCCIARVTVDDVFHTVADLISHSAAGR